MSTIDVIVIMRIVIIYGVVLHTERMKQLKYYHKYQIRERETIRVLKRERKKDRKKEGGREKERNNNNNNKEHKDA